MRTDFYCPVCRRPATIVAWGARRLWTASQSDGDERRYQALKRCCVCGHEWLAVVVSEHVDLGRLTA